jgi:outer membrane receptor protein involved in Fe transport
VRSGVDGFLLLRGSTESGYRVDTPARTSTAFATVGRRGDAGDVALSLLAAHDRIGQAGSLPESWLRVDPRANYTEGDFFAPRLLHVALRGEHALGGGDARLRGNVFARRNATEQFNVNVGAPSTRAFVTSVSRGGTAELTIPTTLGALPLGFTVGAEAAWSDVRYRVFDERSAYADTLPADCDAAGLCENARVNQTDAALYAQGTLTLLAPLSLTAAARYDLVRVPFRDLTAPANDGTSTFRHLSPRVGVNVSLPADLRGFAAVSGGFRAPAALELACADAAAPCPLPFSLGDDPPLAPVSLLDAEAGVDWEPRHGVALEATVYRADARQEIVFAAARNAAGYFQNVARTRRQGVELSATAALGGGLRAGASYTYTDATYRHAVLLASANDDADSARAGDRFPLSPAHRATASLGVTRALHATLFDAELSMRAASSQFLRGDEANDHAPLPGYATAALRVAIERPRWSLAANITNLFDRRYDTFGIFGQNPLGAYPGAYVASSAAPVERFLSPGYPRALTVTVDVRR